MKRTYLALILLMSFDALSAELWSVAQLQKAISKSDHKPVLLDVRTQSEYNDGHIQNAINIPHDQILKEPQLLSAYKESQVVVFCRSGVRAGKVIEMLEGLGFKEIIDIDGDMLAWNEAGHTVEINNE
ncbi:rhodanese-like domain-containing protein [Gammaproteobacteria bacterium]|nr:rhodanese-like domain-containing protein [Gammaproteobacteria bacterium]